MLGELLEAVAAEKKKNRLVGGWAGLIHIPKFRFSPGELVRLLTSYMHIWLPGNCGQETARLHREIPMLMAS